MFSESDSRNSQIIAFDIAFEDMKPGKPDPIHDAYMKKIRQMYIDAGLIAPPEEKPPSESTESPK